MDYLRNTRVRRLQMLGTHRMHMDSIRRILPFQVNWKWYVFSGSEDKTLKLWNVEYKKNETVPESRIIGFYGFEFGYIFIYLYLFIG